MNGTSKSRRKLLEDFIWKGSKVKQINTYYQMSWKKADNHNMSHLTTQSLASNSQTCDRPILLSVVDFRINLKHRVLSFFEASHQLKPPQKYTRSPISLPLVAYCILCLFMHIVYYIFLKYHLVAVTRQSLV